MKKKCRFVGIMFLCILLAAFLFVKVYEKTTGSDYENNNEFTVVTSFYPMYIAALNVTDGADNVKLENLSEPQTGCLHDFQLTPEDMKLLSSADVFIINGGGIESFMSDIAESYPTLTTVEACKKVNLLGEADSHEEHDHDEDADIHEGHDHDEDADIHEGHDHDEDADIHEGHDHSEVNAHAWMSVSRYRVMVSTIAEELAKADPKNADTYEANAKAYDLKLAELESRQQQIKKETQGRDVIIFHEAYEYVADDFGMNVCYVMDLDEERAVSAGEVSDVVNEVQKNGVSVILAEELYGRDLGDTVSRETDIEMGYIDPLNRGDYDKDSYIDGMEHNFSILEEVFKNED